jgi:predicted DNA-binding transcriptional regulator YafY
MTQREFISRLNLIISKLKKGPATYNEINDYLKRESELQGYNFNTSKRTFQRDLDEIRSIYHTNIQYDFSNKWYNIEEGE